MYENLVKKTFKLVIDEFKKSDQSYLLQQIPLNYHNTRELLRALLIIHNFKLSNKTIEFINKILKYELENDILITNVNQLHPIIKIHDQRQLILWKGDITTIKIDVIVNAANLQLLGCFQPQHRCIDNVIHAKAGPQLRYACQEIVNKNLELNKIFVEGQAIITKAYQLPSNYVLHTVGPNLNQEKKGKIANQHDEDTLASCYISCLELANSKQLTSICFCSISTGIFGYPIKEASKVAIQTVYNWLLHNSQASIKKVIFNVFSNADKDIYMNTFHEQFPHVIKKPLTTSKRIAQLIADADGVLICAGAGLSALNGRNVYVNEEDFQRFYPGLNDYGYHTAYECMSLFTDKNVPLNVKWGYQAKHIFNQRYDNSYTHPAYKELYDIIEKKDYFVFTTNVDGLFVRNKFKSDCIFTIQGDWQYLQCLKPCSNQLFPSYDIIKKAIDAIDDNSSIIQDKEAIPICPNCGDNLYGWVRGGDWFIENNEIFTKQRDQWYKWRNKMFNNNNNKKIVILEIGCGFNTPTLTRFQMEHLAQNHSNTTLIRINPQHPKIPAKINNSIEIQDGWSFLSSIKNNSV